MTYPDQGIFEALCLI